VEDKRFYLKALLAAMWNYRFLHRDLEHLLESDPNWPPATGAFPSAACARARRSTAVSSRPASWPWMPAQIESLTINAWIVLTSWVRFLSTTREHSAHLGEEAFKRGVYQVLVLELGFVTDRPARRGRLCQEFHVPFNQALEH
jgi:hypothetical protein